MFLVNLISVIILGAMVRVISCFHFASQRVEGGDGYIVDLRHIPPARLCLAFPWKLEIWDLVPKLKRFTTFPAVESVIAVDYSEKGSDFMQFC